MEMNRVIRRAPCGSLRFVADAGRIVAAWGGSTFGALPSETVVRRPHRTERVPASPLPAKAQGIRVPW